MHAEHMNYFLALRNLSVVIGVLCIRQLGIMHSTELLKGTLQTIILKILADHGKMYGYEITQRVKELSDGTILLTEGALYPTLHKMEAEGLLKTETETIGKRMRKYYSLTAAGKHVVADKVTEFIAFIKTMSTVLNVAVA
jgi:DNA-binding PadR family transcriptional regulator